MKPKFVTDHQDAAIKLASDVGVGNFKSFDTATFPTNLTSSFFPDTFAEKCTHFTVVVSGSSVNSSPDWLLICPHRVDVSGNCGAKVYDIDPFVVALDPNNGNPYPTGLVKYHQKFESRVSPIEGHAGLSKVEAVAAIRSQLQLEHGQMTDASPPVLSALNYMAGEFRRLFPDLL